MNENARCWVDGQPVEQISAFDRGLLYGDGFFTTIRIEGGRLLNWPAHQARIRNSLTRLKFSGDGLNVLENALRTILTELGEADGVLKCITTRGEGPRGYAPAGGMTQIVQFFPGLPAAQPSPLKLKISAVTAMTQPQLAGLKHLNQLTQVLAAAESGGEEVLMLDEQHAIVGGLYSNIVFCQGRTLYTPRLDRAGVQGTTLQALRKVAEKLGYDWRETQLALGRVCPMQGAALLNAVRGLRPIERIETTAPCAFDVKVWEPLAEQLEAYMRAQAWPSRAE